MQKIKSFAVVIFFGIAALGLTVEARATVIWEVDGTGLLTGARNVNVNGALYDVAFVDGTCIDLFDGCDEASDFPFPSQAAALAASQALLDQVFLDTPLAPGNFDTVPTLTNGCISLFSGACYAFTPYQYQPDPPSAGDVWLGGAINAVDPNQDALIDTYLGIGADLTNFDGGVYTTWTSSVPVPTPPTAFLFGTGLAALFGFVGIGRRRERQG